MKKPNFDDFPEVGYTPNNLRFLIKELGLTQKQFGEDNKIPLRTIQAYCAQINNISHRDMPLKVWFALLQRHKSKTG